MYPQDKVIEIIQLSTLSLRQIVALIYYYG